MRRDGVGWGEASVKVTPPNFSSHSRPRPARPPSLCRVMMSFLCGQHAGTLARRHAGRVVPALHCGRGRGLCRPSWRRRCHVVATGLFIFSAPPAHSVPCSFFSPPPPVFIFVASYFRRPRRALLHRSMMKHVVMNTEGVIMAKSASCWLAAPRSRQGMAQERRPRAAPAAQAARHGNARKYATPPSAEEKNETRQKRDEFAPAVGPSGKRQCAVWRRIIRRDFPAGRSGGSVHVGCNLLKEDSICHVWPARCVSVCPACTPPARLRSAGWAGPHDAPAVRDSHPPGGPPESGARA